MKVRPAKKSDLSDIVNCAERIKSEYFLRHNIPQWQDGYPSKEDFAADIDAGRLFVMYLGEALIGFISVSAEHEPNYDVIYEGEWKSSEPYVVVHRFGINPDWHGMGMGTSLFGIVPRLCEAHGINAIRIDTHEQNSAMIRFLEKNGFERAGIIHLANGEPRIAFEKIL